MITAASVLITASISVPDQLTADSTASTLSTGILADATALTAALTNQFATDGVVSVTPTVEAITVVGRTSLEPCPSPAPLLSPLLSYAARASNLSLCRIRASKPGLLHTYTSES